MKIENKMMMKKLNIDISKNYFLIIGFFMFGHITSAQEDPNQIAEESLKYMQQAEKALEKDDFALAEANYRKAIAKNPGNAEARYNLGNLYFKKEATTEAAERHKQSANVATEDDLKHRSFHNQGNAFMKQKKYKEAIESYKNALRNYPEDDKTRYNLALAKKLLEEQKKDGGGKDNKDQDKKEDQNKDENKENQDQKGDQGEEKKDENGQPKDQDGEDKKEEKEENKKEGDEKKEEEGKPKNEKENPKNEGKPESKRQQPVPGQLSPQQIKNLLEAMANEEKKVQEKINARKAKGTPVPTEKDW